MNKQNEGHESENLNEPQLTKGFKFRVILTLVFFIFAVLYILRFLRII